MKSLTWEGGNYTEYGNKSPLVSRQEMKVTRTILAELSIVWRTPTSTVTRMPTDVYGGNLGYEGKLLRMRLVFWM